MSTKKAAFTMPDRSAQAAADAFVAKGADNPPATAQKAPTEAPAGKLARLTIDLPADLHKRFKIACAQHDTKMMEEVRAFIEDWTQKHS